MTTLLLDASVWLAAQDTLDPLHEAASTLLESAAVGDPRLATLDLTLYEVANVATGPWNSPERAKCLVGQIDDACGDSIDRADAALLRAASGIAAEHGISVYDAAYVAAARRCGWTLVSCDHRDLVDKGLALAPDGDLPA